jgi:hypothetical protein
LAALIAVLCWCAIGASPAGAYDFNANNTVKPLGPPVTMFDYSTQACEEVDIPDAPARAINDDGKVSLFASHYVTRLKTGPSLRTATPTCAVTMGSLYDADPSGFADREWVSSPYILPGGKVVALMHEEYQGHSHPGMCPSGDYFKCWYNAITLGVSNDRGATFQHASPSPTNLVAATPYRYEADTGPAGVMMPSNIIKFSSDNMYYAMVAVQGYRAQEAGTCLMRTNDLTDPRSWRAWDGTGFNVSFINPYIDTAADPTQHVCEPVSVNEIGMMSSSVHYNLYLNSFVLIGQSGDTFRTRAEDPGIYWSTSPDMIHWTPARLLMKSELLWTHECGDSDPIMHPSLLDPSTTSPNFEIGGRQMDLFFTQFHWQYDSWHCWMGMDRDLVRIPIEFNKQPDCTTMVAKPDYLPAMTRNLSLVTLGGATEPDGEAMSMKINSVSQNQPVTGPGDSSSPDAMRTNSPNQVLLRAEHGASGGRVYRINVTVTDSKGAVCTVIRKVYSPRNAVDTSDSYGSFKVSR